MTTNPIDVASLVSPRLSALLLSRINDPETEQPVTLATVRHFLADLVPEDFREAERMHRFDVDPSLLDELEALVEEYGPAALAVDFAQAFASEALSCVIEALLDDDNRENLTTLGTVREAILSGLAARLVGDGALEDDEDDTLLAEVEGLIEQYGSDAPAEACLHYE